MERTLILVKPDGVQRQLIGRIIARFEAKGIKLAALKLLRLSAAQADSLYSVHAGKKFHQSLIKFITSGPLAAMVLEGPKVIGIGRKLLGATFGPQAESGTIRGDFGSSKSFNLVHGSDSPEAAAREIPILFKPEEIIEYNLVTAPWTFDLAEDGV